MSFTWDAFLTRYGPMARALASRIVAPPQTAEDIVQEASLALHRALERDSDRFTGSEEARNYFLRTVQNLALKSRRDGRAEEPLGDLPAASDESGEKTALQERRRRLGKLLVTLEPFARDLIARRFLRHQTLAHISTETGIPISTLHDRENRLLAELRRRMGAEEGADSRDAIRGGAADPATSRRKATR